MKKDVPTAKQPLVTTRFRIKIGEQVFAASAMVSIEDALVMGLEGAINTAINKANTALLKQIEEKPGSAPYMVEEFA